MCALIPLKGSINKMGGDEYSLPGGIKVNVIDSCDGIEIGSTVICIKTNLKGVNLKNITKGKKYEVVGLYKANYKDLNGEEGIFSGHLIVQVSDDGKYINGFPSEIFTPLDKIRKDKINKVID